MRKSKGRRAAEAIAKATGVELESITVPIDWTEVNKYIRQIVKADRDSKRHLKKHGGMLIK